jgi:hypothetical protein
MMSITSYQRLRAAPQVRPWPGVAIRIASASTYLQGRKEIQEPIFWYGLAAVQGFLLVFGFASSLWGTSVEGIVRAIETRLTRVFEGWLAKAAGDEPTEPPADSGPSSL